MANIKSQIKRNETNELAREKNNTEKNAARTAIKKVETLVGRWQKGGSSGSPQGSRFAP
jgi:small subunit ribosomal protein S20